MYTGVNPGKHGVFGFLDYDGYDWDVVNSTHVREHALWELLDERGMSSVVVNVPVTHPPAEIDGAVIPGYIGPEDPDCHPEGILEEVREAIGEYRVYPNYVRDDERYTEDEKLEEYCALAGMRGEAFRYLAGRFDPDFGFVEFQKTDTVFHEFDGDPEKVRRIYETTDDQIGQILEACDPDRVFVASDHGIGPYENYEFRINEFLREEGYVEATTGGKGMPSLTPIRDQLRADGTRTDGEQVDFPASRAYTRARIELGVRINLAGREPEGKVPEGEYESVREELIELLSGVRTPDGDRVFGEVGPREEYFHGPHVEEAVDVVTVPNGFEHLLSAQLVGSQFGPPTEPWNHTLEGLFVAAGEGIDAEADLSGAHLFDVAPTVLSALGVPYSDRMDGSVLPVVDDVGSTEYHVYSGDTTRATDDDTVEQRLSDLGYLE
jgi:predicted AlkP superfamily phosphohydrolase/phosphomutase